MRRRLRRALAPVVAIALTLVLLSGPVQAGQSTGGGVEKLGPEARTLVDALLPGQMASVIVRLRTQADLTQVGGADRDAHLTAAINALRNHANSSQTGLR